MTNVNYILDNTACAMRLWRCHENVDMIENIESFEYVHIKLSFIYD